MKGSVIFLWLTVHLTVLGADIGKTVEAASSINTNREVSPIDTRLPIQEPFSSRPHAAFAMKAPRPHPDLLKDTPLPKVSTPIRFYDRHGQRLRFFIERSRREIISNERLERTIGNLLRRMMEGQYVDDLFVDGEGKINYRDEGPIEVIFSRTADDSGILSTVEQAEQQAKLKARALELLWQPKPEDFSDRFFAVDWDGASIQDERTQLLLQNEVYRLLLGEDTSLFQTNGRGDILYAGKPLGVRFYFKWRQHAEEIVPNTQIWMGARLRRHVAFYFDRVRPLNEAKRKHIDEANQLWTDAIAIMNESAKKDRKLRKAELDRAKKLLDSVKHLYEENATSAARKEHLPTLALWQARLEEQMDSLNYPAAIELRSGCDRFELIHESKNRIVVYSQAGGAKQLLLQFSSVPKYYYCQGDAFFAVGDMYEETPIGESVQINLAPEMSNLSLAQVPRSHVSLFLTGQQLRLIRAASRRQKTILSKDAGLGFVISEENGTLQYIFSENGTHARIRLLPPGGPWSYEFFKEATGVVLIRRDGLLEKELGRIEGFTFDHVTRLGDGIAITSDHFTPGKDLDRNGVEQISAKNALYVFEGNKLKTTLLPEDGEIFGNIQAQGSQTLQINVVNGGYSVLVSLNGGEHRRILDFSSQCSEYVFLKGKGDQIELISQSEVVATFAGNPEFACMGSSIIFSTKNITTLNRELRESPIIRGPLSKKRLGPNAVILIEKNKKEATAFALEGFSVSHLRNAKNNFSVDWVGPLSFTSQLDAQGKWISPPIHGDANSAEYRFIEFAPGRALILLDKKPIATVTGLKSAAARKGMLGIVADKLSPLTPSSLTKSLIVGALSVDPKNTENTEPPSTSGTRAKFFVLRGNEITVEDHANAELGEGFSTVMIREDERWGLSWNLWTEKNKDIVLVFPLGTNSENPIEWFEPPGKKINLDSEAG